jgi:hypothetical protein
MQLQLLFLLCKKYAIFIIQKRECQASKDDGGSEVGTSIGTNEQRLEDAEDLKSDSIIFGCLVAYRCRPREGSDHGGCSISSSNAAV